MIFGELASPILTDIFTTGDFSTNIGIIGEDVGRFMFGDSTFSVDDTSDISIKERHFKGTRGLWKLLTRKNVNRAVVTDDLKRYDYLTVDRRQFAGIRTRGNGQTSRGPKFRDNDF